MRYAWKTGAFLFIISVLPFGQVLAYDDQTTHPALTDETVDFYNQESPDGKITPEEKEWMVEGSILEDTSPRWINHFYDPVYKTGWTGEKAGAISSSTMRELSSIGLSSENAVSALEWVHDARRQEEYSRYGGHRTWEKALDYYAQGNEKEAYITLGHVLHLLEDLSVPDHTRNDTHAEGISAVTGDLGSPYEQYASRWNRSNLKIADGIKSAIPIKNSVDDYLVSMAEYSNKYFFSKDTINDPKYNMPKVTYSDNEYGYGIDENGRRFPLARVVANKNNTSFITDYVLDRNDKEILDAYFTRLSKQAVINGAGIIALFKKQGEDVKVNKDFVAVKLDFSPFVMPAFSPLGELTKAKDAFVSYINSLKSLFGLNPKNLTGDVTEALLPSPPVLTPNNNSTSSPPANVQIRQTAPPPAPSFSASSDSAPVSFPPSSSTPAQNREPDISAASAPEIASSAYNPPPPASPPSLPPPPPGGVIAEPAIQTNNFAGEAPTVSSSSSGDIAPAAEETSSIVSSALPHPVISEILFAERDGAQFVEFYNSATGSVDLSDWSLFYTEEGSTSSEPLGVFDSPPIMETGKFFLIGFGSSSPSVETDFSSALPLPSGGRKINIALLDSNGNEADSMEYSSSSINAPGESLERKALLDGACVSAGDYEFSGNACDTGGNGDFEIRAVPNPQNSNSLPEPRGAPGIPAPLDGSPGIAEYSSSTDSINFAWKPSRDEAGNTSTVRYELIRLSDGSSSLVASTSQTEFIYGAVEPGANYNFELSAIDRDGMRSLATSVSVDVPVPSFGPPPGPEDLTYASSVEPALSGEPAYLTVSWSAPSVASGAPPVTGYKFSYYASSSPDEITEQIVDEPWIEVPVMYPEHYVFQVQSIDETGATSSPTLGEWDFPPDYEPVILMASLETADLCV